MVCLPCPYNCDVAVAQLTAKEAVELYGGAVDAENPLDIVPQIDKLDFELAVGAYFDGVHLEKKRCEEAREMRRGLAVLSQFRYRSGRNEPDGDDGAPPRVDGEVMRYLDDVISSVVNGNGEERTGNGFVLSAGNLQRSSAESETGLEWNVSSTITGGDDVAQQKMQKETAEFVLNECRKRKLVLCTSSWIDVDSKDETVAELGELVSVAVGSVA